MEKRQRPERPGNGSTFGAGSGYSGSLSAVRIISKLHEAVSSEQRLLVTSALLSRLQSKEYSTSMIYDHLLQAGIVNTLCLHLCWIFNHLDSAQAQADGICKLLGLIVTRCSARVCDVSTLYAGPEFFQFLLMALTRWKEDVALTVLSIFHVCSASLRGSSLLFQCRLVRSLPWISNYNDPSMEDYFGLLKNLSNFGEEHCMEIVEQESLMMRLAAFPFQPGPCSKKNLERLPAIIRNLAVSPTTRPFLAQHGNLLGAVARMGSSENRHVQRNMLSFLLNVAQDMDYGATIALHGDGVILNLLRQLMMENHTATRRRAVRVVRMLTREAAGSQLARDSDLIAALSHRAMLDPSNEVRAEATDALARLGSFLSAQTSWYHTSLLVNLSSAPAALPEAFSVSLISYSPQLINQLPLNERGTLVECLGQISLSPSSSNECKKRACSAILAVSEDESNREYMALPSILEALVQDACNYGGAQLTRHTSGIQGLVFLATVPGNRIRMAVHRGLLQTLIRYATSTKACQTKQDVKKAIAALVSEV
jgi:hypothetical protein